MHNQPHGHSLIFFAPDVITQFLDTEVGSHPRTHRRLTVHTITKVLILSGKLRDGSVLQCAFPRVNETQFRNLNYLDNINIQDGTAGNYADNKIDVTGHLPCCRYSAKHVNSYSQPIPLNTPLGTRI